MCSVCAPFLSCKSSLLSTSEPGSKRCLESLVCPDLKDLGSLFNLLSILPWLLGVLNPEPGNWFSSWTLCWDAPVGLEPRGLELGGLEPVGLEPVGLEFEGLGKDLQEPFLLRGSNSFKNLIFCFLACCKNINKSRVNEYRINGYKINEKERWIKEQ